ncbi:MAG: DnaJ domain-containing protein [Phycisphaerales bacterium]
MSEPAPDQSPENARPAPHAAGLHARREPRLHTPDLRCSVGKVADITGSGMRMIVDKDQIPELGDVQSYTFTDPSDSITVTGTVKWIRKGSAFSKRCEVGVEFVRLDQGLRDSIVRLAVHGKLKDPAAGCVQIRHTDLYKLLGVTRYASEEQLQDAFRAQTRQWHPDANGSPEAAQRFEEIHKAYSVLRDEEQRAKYDLRFADQHDRAA